MHYYIYETVFYYGVFIVLMIPLIIADFCVRRPWQCKLLLLIGVIMISLFAGMRSLSVGTDTRNTVLHFFTPSLSYRSLSQIITAKHNMEEPFYLYLSFFLQRITKDHHLFLFTLQLLTVGPVAVYAYRERERIPIAVTLFIYLMLFYQASFNITRHCAATACLLLAAYYYKEHQWFRAVFWNVMALLLHSSAKYGTLLYLFLFLFVSIKNQNARIVANLILCAVLAVLLVNWKTVTMQLSTLSFFEQYADYAEFFTNQTGNHLAWFIMRPRTIFDEGLRLIGFFIVAFMLKSDEGDRNSGFIRYIKYGMLFSVIIFTFFVVTIHSYMGNRISLYFDFLWIPAFGLLSPREEIGQIHPHLYEKQTPVGGNVSAKAIVSILYCLAYNALIFMFANWGETLPYSTGY